MARVTVQDAVEKLVTALTSYWSRLAERVSYKLAVKTL